MRRLDLAGLRQVVQIDASPIGQNARSTPATYSGAFDQIRQLFAGTAYARRRRWKPGHFSFNTREGQCPTCRGLGGIDLDVQYLPDINVQCPTCHGARFNDATLEVRVDGLTIADVLALTVHDALEQFRDQRGVAAALRPVDEVGLGYLRLGEPTPSLSGGESQRLRIASRLRSQPARHPVRLRRASAPGCIRSTSLPWSACSTGCWTPGPRSSSSTTTWTCWARPTTSSTWARAAAPTAGASSPRARRAEVARRPGQRHRPLAGRAPRAEGSRPPLKDK